jgi:hypothetical protein
MFGAEASHFAKQIKCFGAEATTGILQTEIKKTGDCLGTKAS